MLDDSHRITLRRFSSVIFFDAREFRDGFDRRGFFFTFERKLTSGKDSPLEKKDVLRPIHSVAGGEFGGTLEDDEAAVVERYLLPFHITSLPSTVSKDSLRVLCLLVPPRLLDESLLEHSSTASTTSSDDDGRFSTA